MVLCYGVTYIWQESGTTFSTLSRAVFALTIEKTGNVWAQYAECYNKDTDQIRLIQLKCFWDWGEAGCLWLGAAVSAYCSEPQNTVTSIHALLWKAEKEPGGVWSFRHFSYLPLASVKQEKTSEGCFETYALGSLCSNASFLFSLALLHFKHQSIQLSLFFISAVKEVFLATWIVWHFFLYKSYKWVKKQPVYFPHLTFLFFKWYPEEKIKYPRTPSAFRSRQKKYGLFLPPCESFISMEVTFLWFPWVLPSWSNHYLFQILTIQNPLVTLKLWWMLAEG